MKSLNRTLSLVLVVAMCLGLMGVASAATFTDSTAVKYNEAVDVMSTIGVINGLDTGKFDPAGKLTREQAAKVICYLTMGKAAADGLKAGVAPFSDVAADRWSAGSIAYCVQQGIIAGRGDKTFAPTAEVTGYEFAKMLLVALGYDATVEQFMGPSWNVSVAKRTFANKLPAGNSAFNGNAALTREEAALYALNLIKCKTVSYASKGTEIVVNGITVKQGASAPEQKDNATFMATYFSSLKLNDSGMDAVGRVANIWTYKGLEIGKYASGADFTFNTAAAGTTDAARIAAMGFTGYTLKNNSVTPIVNGVAGAAITSLTKLADLTGNGTIVEVYVDSDDSTQIKRIIVIKSYLAQITSINTLAKIVTVKTTEKESYTVDNSLNPKVYAALSTMAVKDYVLITPTADKQIAGLAASKTVTGTVTKNQAYPYPAITVGGTEYKLSATQVDVNKIDASTMTSKATVTLYLDSFGNAIYITNATTTTPYIFVLKTSQSLVGSSIVNTTTGYAPDGTVVSLNTGSSSYVPGLYSYKASSAFDVATDNSEYTLALVPQNDGAAKVGTFMKPTKAIKYGDTTLIGATTGANVTLSYAANVKFIFKSANGITVKSGVQVVPVTAIATTYALIGNNASDEPVITAVYVVGADPIDATGTSILFIAKANGVEYINGVAYNSYTAMIDGVPTAISTKGAATPGEFYNYAKDATTGIYAISATPYTADNAANSVAKGVVTKIDAGYILNTNNPKLTDRNAANAVICDLKFSGIATLSDIQAAVDAGKTVTVAAIYGGLDSVANYNAVSYLYIIDVSGGSGGVVVNASDYAIDTTGLTIKAPVYYKTAAHGELDILAAIKAYLTSKGYTVGNTTLDSTTYKIQSSMGEFKWDTATAPAVEGVKVKVNGTDKLLDKTTTVTSLGAGTFVKIDGTFTAVAGTIADGSSYETGYYSVAAPTITAFAAAPYDQDDFTVSANKAYAKDNEIVTLTIECVAGLTADANDTFEFAITATGADGIVNPTTKTGVGATKAVMGTGTFTVNAANVTPVSIAVTATVK